MQSYLAVILRACAAFPFLAIVLTLPYMAYHYKKFGSIPLWRTAIVYSFMLYLTVIYFLVVFPLPPIADVAKMTTPYWSYVPLASVWEYFQKYGYSYSDWHAWWKIARSSVVQELGFNILMFVPLGIYLRYYFQRTRRQTVLIGFFLSLFLELTQLTGLYFIYPRPYRLFDVDDLFNNTLGALVGYVLAPLLMRFLPKRQSLDEKAYRKGEKVPFFRRVFAIGIDWCLLLAVWILAQWACAKLGWNAGTVSRWCLVIEVVLYFVALQWLLHGRTFGKMLVSLRLTDRNGSRAKLWQYLVRYGFLYGLVLPLPLYTVVFITQAFSTTTLPLTLLWLWLAMMSMVSFCAFLVESLTRLLGGKSEFLYGQISRTKVTSTILVPEPMDGPMEPVPLPSFAPTSPALGADETVAQAVNSVAESISGAPQSAGAQPEAPVPEEPDSASQSADAAQSSTARAMETTPPEDTAQPQASTCRQSVQTVHQTADLVQPEEAAAQNFPDAAPVSQNVPAARATNAVSHGKSAIPPSDTAFSGGDEPSRSKNTP